MNKISIITPVLNGEKYIAETIESIIFQKGDFVLEYIIIDAGSEDDTIKICNYYQMLTQRLVDDNLLNQRSLTIFSEKDNGLFDGLSKGIKKCTGDIIGYLNSSDRYLPGALQSVVSAFESNDNIAWLTGWNTFSNEMGVIFDAKYPFYYDNSLIRQYFYGAKNNHIQQESTFWSKRLNNYINHDELSNFQYAGDYYLWYMFSKRTKLWIVNSLIGNFRIHQNQLSMVKNNYINEIIDKGFMEKKQYIRSFVFYILQHLPVRFKRYLNRYSINVNIGAKPN